MTIDSFLFFNELDLLKIRIEYLWGSVDKFVILEAAQTFSGKKKTFLLADRMEEFHKYRDKIVYFKLDEFHSSYESVLRSLDTQGTPVCARVTGFLERHAHYDKAQMNWVLDSYHREMLHVALAQVASACDTVILSDLDEIPSVLGLQKAIDTGLDRPVSLRQREFSYYLNLHKNNDWIGSVVSRYGAMAQHSLNDLRIDSKEGQRRFVAECPVEDGGYHFTSVGDESSIRKKIESWGHQEFNKRHIIRHLPYNIATGQDIFERTYGTTMKKVDLHDTDYFDERMTKILCHYGQYLLHKDTRVVSPYALYNLFRRVMNGIRRRLSIR